MNALESDTALPTQPPVMSHRGAVTCRPLQVFPETHVPATEPS